MAEVAVESVVKDFGPVQVLRGVSFEAKEGEFVALVGPSGCGKSTLLRCIAGLEAVNAGVIKIGGRIVNNLEPKERDAAMVFQNYALYPHMTVRQNMGYSLKLRKIKPDEIRPRVEEAAAILGLTDYLERYPRQLSGGQRQRVAMGRAIVRKPSVFLFDEPLSNLDAALRVQMRAEIRALHRRLGVTSIYVTHDQIEAMTMADKIVVLRNGNVEQVGAPLELYDRPANTFVAQFIGSPAMNLIAGVVAGSKIRLADGMLVAVQSALQENQEVTLGIRPEHFDVSDAAQPNSIPAVILRSESTGTMTYASMAALEETTLQLAIPGRRSLEPNQKTNLLFDPRHCHLFDAASLARL